MFVDDAACGGQRDNLVGTAVKKGDYAPSALVRSTSAIHAAISRVGAGGGDISSAITMVIPPEAGAFPANRGGVSRIG